VPKKTFCQFHKKLLVKKQFLGAVDGGAVFRPRLNLFFFLWCLWLFAAAQKARLLGVFREAVG
jgi:hypothetical protein